MGGWCLALVARGWRLALYKVGVSAVRRPRVYAPFSWLIVLELAFACGRGGGCGIGCGAWGDDGSRIGGGAGGVNDGGGERE